MSNLNNRRKIMLILLDFLCFVLSFTGVEIVACISKRLKFSLSYCLLAALIYLIFLFGTRLVTRVYENIWRYATSKVYLYMVISDVIGGIAAMTVLNLTGINSSLLFSISQGFGIAAAFDILTLTSRFAYQQHYRRSGSNDNNKIGVAIVGAGKTGVLLAQELMFSKHSHYHPVCFIDVDKDKVGSRILGLRVFSEDDISERLRNMPVQEIFITLANINGDSAKKIHDFYSATGCKVKLYDFPLKDNSEINPGKKIIREIRIEDLLSRNSMNITDSETADFYKNKVVMVTGGGGSIGSELCRQIASCTPKQLIILDIYENNAYDIQQELLIKYGSSLNLAVEIASVRDRTRLETLFAYYRPEIVFHAAAHKHVPLMEHSCCEAVKNNVFGTYNTADMAEKYGTEKFILISTDKAVNPTNVMGASKRMCEMIVQCRTDSKTSFAAVRFGNVLGSNGSVIPLFKNQIENGGPVTITDKRIIRYFMTIPEASQLVIHTGAMARSGELFVLDMGKPVKILDLAENLIRLSGYKPYDDIEIVEIGLRPGEKLYEELLIKTETLDKTDNEMIFIEKDRPLARHEINEKLCILRDTIQESENEVNQDRIKDALKQVVPTFYDPEIINGSVYETELFETGMIENLAENSISFINCDNVIVEAEQFEMQ